MCLSKKKQQQQRVNLEPPRPMAARLKKKKKKKKKTACKPRTASAYGRAVKKKTSGRLTARLKKTIIPSRSRFKII